MNSDPIAKLVRVGFSEYEAKAYLGLLKKSPVSGYELSKLSGVPRSMIYEVAGKLTARGAAMTLRMSDSTKYAPVPAAEFLDHFMHEQEELVGSLREDLTAYAATPDLEYVLNIEGDGNIMAKAIEMLDQAERQIYLALVPVTFPTLRPALEKAIGRGVRVVIYTTEEIDLPGGRVVVAHVAAETLRQAQGLGLILVIDGEEVLVAEWLEAAQARASWAGSRLIVFLAEHHLRTDLYLPEILTLLGDRALEIIHPDDRSLFSQALESHLDG